MTPDQLKKVSVMRHMAKSGAARQIREKQFISAREMAECLGVNVSDVSRWERGATSPRSAVALRWYELLVT